MIHKSTLINWIKTKLDSLSAEDETDYVHLEARLVRCISEYRKLDLESIKLSKDFDLRLMNRLEHTNLDEVEAYDFRPRRSFRTPVLFATAASIALIGLFIVNSPFNENSKNQVQASNQNKIDDSLIKELKSHPEKIRMLEDLENYYSRTGKIEQASEIHNMLETVSKRY